MSRQLLILRHAKSAWDTDAPSDYERPLAKRGRKDASRVGQWLRDNGLMPDHVVSSPAERAMQTTLKVCKELGIDKKSIRSDPRIYDADVASLMKVLADCPASARNVLLVGHNPGLESLMDYLCGDDTPLSEDGKLLPTATVAQLQIAKTWDNLRPGVATLVSITRPASLT